MVLSDGLVYFLKIENCFCRIHQNYLVALKSESNDISTRLVSRQIYLNSP